MNQNDPCKVMKKCCSHQISFTSKAGSIAMSKQQSLLASVVRIFKNRFSAIEIKERLLTVLLTRQVCFGQAGRFDHIALSSFLRLLLLAYGKKFFLSHRLLSGCYTQPMEIYIGWKSALSQRSPLYLNLMNCQRWEFI